MMDDLQAAAMTVGTHAKESAVDTAERLIAAHLPAATARDCANVIINGLKYAVGFYALELERIPGNPKAEIVIAQVVRELEHDLPGLREALARFETMKAQIGETGHA